MSARKGWLLLLAWVCLSVRAGYTGDDADLCTLDSNLGRQQGSAVALACTQIGTGSKKGPKLGLGLFLSRRRPGTRKSREDREERDEVEGAQFGEMGGGSVGYVAAGGRIGTVNPKDRDAKAVRRLQARRAKVSGLERAGGNGANRAGSPAGMGRLQTWAAHLRTSFCELLGAKSLARINRWRYSVELLPRVGPADFSTSLWPSPFRAVLVISADFELAWGWRHVRFAPDPLEYALDRAAKARRNIPILLQIFDSHGIPITWAAVGHLFLQRCHRVQGRPHPNLPRVPFFENIVWRYRQGDWFDADPCSNWQRHPAWYAPDLLRSILDAPVRHEIACHTFSHIDCSDRHCPPEVLDAELAQCQELARRWGIQLRSFVFPGNFVGNLAVLKKRGFIAYRSPSRYELDVPRRDELGLWRIPGKVCWEKPEGWPTKAWAKALERCVDRALETGTVLHLWFHPECDELNVEEIFPALLEYIAQHRNDLWVTTMAGLAEWLSSIDQETGRELGPQSVLDATHLPLEPVRKAQAPNLLNG